MNGPNGADAMALSSFASVDRSALRWLRSGDVPTEFTLSSGDSPVAVLRWSKGSGSLATVTTAEGSWTFKRAGFLSPHVTARRGGEGAPVASLTAHFRRHEIRIAHAPVYQLFHLSHILPGWTVVAPEGAEVLHIEPAAEHRSLVGGAVLVSSRLDAPELLLLVVMSWYFIVLAWLEDELVETLVPYEGPDAPRKPEWSA